MSNRTPIDVLERLEQQLQADVERMRKEGYELQLLINAKPKGKLREMKKNMDKLMIDLSREEKNLKVTQEDLEAERKRAAKKK